MKFAITFAFLLVCTLPAAYTQTPDQARQLATAGRNLEAEKMYILLLEKEPDNPQILLGAAYNYSWAGRYDKAKKVFDQVLAISPNLPEALIGKGYNLAWAGEYAAAKSPFQVLEKVQPGSWEAKKGLGYVYLWQGNSAVAIRYFEELILAFPQQIEFYIALAQAYLQNDQIRLARIALQSGLGIEPGHPVARELLNNTYQQAPLLDLDVLTGYSVTDGMSSFGLRTLQMSGRVNKSLRLFARYDNSLSLDLASLVRQNREAQAITAGGVAKWNHRLTTRLDYGVRLLPEGVRQQVLSVEQVVFLPGNMALKAGGFLGLSKQIDNEWMMYVGVRAPVGKFYAIEPHYFYARVENNPRPESRIMLNNQFRLPKGYEINLGALYGKSSIRAENGSNNVHGAYCSAVLPFSRYIWGLASLRREKGPFVSLTVVSAGIKWRLEK